MSSMRGLIADLVPASCVDGPGNRFVVFMQGCNLNCLACHNPHTIPRHQVETSRWMRVDEVVGCIAEAAPFISGVTVSGGEPTLQWQFVRALFSALRDDPRLEHLSTLVDSNGCAEQAVWEGLAAVTDGAMIDLKALDPAVHRRLTGHGNEAVLASIEHLAPRGLLHEVRLLLVPGENDDAGQLTATARYLAGVDPGMRVTVIGFRLTGARPVAAAFEEPSTQDLALALELLAQGGLRHECLAQRPALAVP